MVNSRDIYPPDAIEVAREFFALAKAEKSPRFTNMKLMKLLYKAQCVCLFERGKPLFSDKVKAWAGGPVVPRVFKENQGTMVVPYSHEELGKPSDLSARDRELIHAIWTRYKHMTGDAMSDATHDEDAYKKAWATAGILNPSPTIPHVDMRTEVEKDRERAAELFDAYVSGMEAGH